MSQFFDLASMVLVPSGYRDGKLYSQKPLSTDGELTFSRGSDIEATRVAANGYIEKAKVNLLLQSNSFDTTWTTANGASVTGGQSGYDGSSDAWLLSTSAAGSQLVQSKSASGVHTLSVYAKAGTYDFCRVLILSANTAYTDFDLASGTIGTQDADTIDATITSVGGGWHRLTVTASDSAITAVRLYAIVADNDITGTSGNIYIQDAQLNYGLVAQEYQETTTTSVVAGITNDMPRLDYSGGASCPSLLLEGSRTNFFKHSEYLSDSFWIDDQITRVQNTTETLSPEGVYNAVKLTETATNARHRMASGTLTISNDTYVTSVFLKKGTARYGYIHLSGTNRYTIVVDLEDGTITDTTTNQTITHQSVEDYGNGWYKCSIAGDMASASSAYIVQFGTAGSATPVYDNYVPIFLGDTSNNIYAYGAQFENGSYPTSYIPTYGTSATRTADANCDILNLLSSGILSSATEWTVFFNVEGTSTGYNLSDGQFFSGQGSTLDVYIRPSNPDEEYARFYWRKDAKYIGSTFGRKICARLSGGAGTTFVDGTLNGTSSISGDYSLLGFARNANLAGVLKQMIIFPTALTDAQCIELTTL